MDYIAAKQAAEKRRRPNREVEQKSLRESVREVAAKLERQKDEALNVGRFMEVVHKYMTFEELTPAMLREFADEIVVRAPGDTGTGNRACL